LANSISVRTLYDEHPINLGEILAKAKSAGVDLNALTAEDLWPFDQDHYGGLQAVEALASALELNTDSRLIDLCSGMGGPARYIATQYGSQIHGVDLNQSRVDGATELTARTGLSDKIQYTCADCCDLPFDDGSFNRALSQEAFLHIENREQLLAECRRVLSDNGKLGFTDWIGSDTLTDAHRKKFGDTFAASRICSIPEYQSLLQGAGFTVECITDLSEDWQTILLERLEMFRSLEDETVARFGQQRHDTYIDNYEFFVARIGNGDLGGARIVAVAG